MLPKFRKKGFVGNKQAFVYYIQEMVENAGMRQHDPLPWITEGVLDAEYKEYLLLAWLQKLKAEFRKTRLYPALTDLIRKHKELGQLQAELVAGKERGEAVGLDLKRLRVLRQAAGDHVGLDDYLDSLIQRALPHLSLAIEEGKTLYDLIENQLRFTPVGIQPLRMEEGYLILTIGQSKGRSLRAYRFHKSRILRGGEAYLQLQLECVEERTASRYEPAESIKWSLIGRHRDLPQPATFHAHVDWAVPLQHTLLPIARRRLLQELTQA